MSSNDGQTREHKDTLSPGLLEVPNKKSCPGELLSKSLQNLRSGTEVAAKETEKKPRSANQRINGKINANAKSKNENSVANIKAESEHCSHAKDEVAGVGSDGKVEAPTRLLIVSSKIRNSAAIHHALHPNIIFLPYKYDASTLDGILNLVGQNLSGKKMESIALILSCTGPNINISGKDEKILNKETIQEQKSVRDFFFKLAYNYLDKSQQSSRLDFLACSAIQMTDSHFIAQQIQSLAEVQVGISLSLSGVEIPMQKNKEENFKQNINAGDLYFRLDKLRWWSGQYQQSLAGFEKIRTVGKGAYGAAVLYRKKDDDSLVILKEINMHDLTAAERQMALNEVKVLAMLDHPNIISYFDSFEEEGILMIEMEYADGGTLAQFLAKQDTFLEERAILLMFQQIVAAIRHTHELKILHRDLKTANIFLTKEGVVKVGDFGIAKLLSTVNKGANTVLGTPYYISPEMCESKPYNDKSDIWALGCILYEMACRQKTFEGSNLPALVNKIMKGQFAPVKDIYSQEFKDLIESMLKQNPDKRPSAHQLLYECLPELLSHYDEAVTDFEDDATNLAGNTKKKKKISSQTADKRSVLYYLEISTMNLMPIELPPRIKIKQVAVGSGHVIVVTAEKRVYSWGEGLKGELGHGNLESYATPALVEALNGKAISKGYCGDGFSVFLSENGIVMTCGDGSSGCLGHGDFCSSFRPRLIEPLLSVDVVAVSCGSHHVVAVGSDSEVFAWGKGTDGRLGLGSEETQCQPVEVQIVEPVFIRDVRCGFDGTMFLTDVGGVLACGSNKDNKLGLNNRQGFLMAMKNIFTKTEVEGQKTPTPVKALARYKVREISMGFYHTAVIVEPGCYIYTFGKNTEGQLGTGNIKPACAPVEVKAMKNKEVDRVQCGEHFTVASTMDNNMCYWGLRFKSSIAGEERASKFGVSHSGQSGSGSAPTQITAVSRQSSATSVGSSKDIVTSHEDCDHHRSTSVGSWEKERSKEHDTSWDDSEIIFLPTPLMKLLQSSEESVTLGSFICFGKDLFVQVETTAPPPKRRVRKKRSFRKKETDNILLAHPRNYHNSASSREGGDEYSSEASEMDTQGTLPTWIKHELADSIQVTDDNEVDDTSDQSDDDGSMYTSLSSIQVNKELASGVASVGKENPTEEHSTLINLEAGVTKKYDSKTNGLSERTNVEQGSTDNTSSTDLMSDTNEKQKKNSGTEKNGSYCNESATPGAKVHVGQSRNVTKQKAASKPAQKPLSRLRAQGKGQQGKFDHLATRGYVSSVTYRKREDTLLSELQHTKEEKNYIEKELKVIKEHHEQREQKLLEEVQRQTSEKERDLRKELEQLKNELRSRDELINQYNKMVQNLQEKLVLMNQDSGAAVPSLGNTEQSLSSSRPAVCNHTSRDRMLIQKKASKICLLQ